MKSLGHFNTLKVLTALAIFMFSRVLFCVYKILLLFQITEIKFKLTSKEMGLWNSSKCCND